MKNLMIALLLTISTSVFAEKVSIIFPQVYNTGSSVQVQVWNHTDRYVTCSGSIWMRTEKGQNYSEYYFDSIMPRFTAYRSFYSRDFSDRIVSVNHSIFCN